jgi:hypothetical protein
LIWELNLKQSKEILTVGTLIFFSINCQYCIFLIISLCCHGNYCSGPRKRKPPPGALAMLEEELVARRTYWRRQRQHEKEVTLKEHLMAQQLLFDMDSVTSKTVQKFLEDIDHEVHDLSESEKREFQRRGGAEQEYKTCARHHII